MECDQSFNAEVTNECNGTGIGGLMSLLFLLSDPSRDPINRTGSTRPTGSTSSLSSSLSSSLIFRSCSELNEDEQFDVDDGDRIDAEGNLPSGSGGSFPSCSRSVDRGGGGGLNFGLGSFLFFISSAASAFEMFSCFFHFVRRFWNQIFTCNEGNINFRVLMRFHILEPKLDFCCQDFSGFPWQREFQLFKEMLPVVL